MGHRRFDYLPVDLYRFLRHCPQSILKVYRTGPEWLSICFNLVCFVHYFILVIYVFIYFRISISDSGLVLLRIPKKMWSLDAIVDVVCGLPGAFGTLPAVVPWATYGDSLYALSNWVVQLTTTSLMIEYMDRLDRLEEPTLGLWPSLRSSESPTFRGLKVGHHVFRTWSNCEYSVRSANQSQLLIFDHSPYGQLYSNIWNLVC